MQSASARIAGAFIVSSESFLDVYVASDSRTQFLNVKHYQVLNYLPSKVLPHNIIMSIFRYTMGAANRNANSHYFTIEVPPIMPQAMVSTGQVPCGIVSISKPSRLSLAPSGFRKRIRFLLV